MQQLDEPVALTHHAHDRLKERMGLPRSARERMANKAFQLGRTHADARGALKRFLDKQWFEHRTCDNVRIYGEFLWFFAGTTLVTVFAIPKNLRQGA